MALAAVAVKTASYLWPEAAFSYSLPPLWHGHEMVFGYAFAVVAGYLLTKPGFGAAALAITAWLAGRIAVFALGGPLFWQAALTLAFPVILFVLAGLPFLRAAKSWRNAIFAPLLAAFVAAELLYQLGAGGLVPGGEARGLLLAMQLILLLIFTMGGRVIAGATSGAHQARGQKLPSVAHPRSEGLGAAALAASAALDAIAAVPQIAGVLATVTGVLAGWRLVQWRVWRVIGHSDVSALHLGFAWVAVGLTVKGYAQITGVLPVFEALHLAMIGGLGTLSLTIMTRTAQQRLRRGTALPAPILVAVGLISLAAMARGATFLPELPREALLLLAATAWSLAFLAFGLHLLRVLAKTARSR